MKKQYSMTCTRAASVISVIFMVSTALLQGGQYKTQNTQALKTSIQANFRTLTHRAANDNFKEELITLRQIAANMLTLKKQIKPNEYRLFFDHYSQYVLQSIEHNVSLYMYGRQDGRPAKTSQEYMNHAQLLGTLLLSFAPDAAALKQNLATLYQNAITQKKAYDAEQKAMAKKKQDEEADAQRKAEDKARKDAKAAQDRKDREDAQRKAQEERRAKQAEDKKRKDAADARKKAQDKARKDAQDAKKKKDREDAQKKAADKARQDAEDAKKAKDREDAQRNAEEAEREKQKEEKKRQDEADAQKKAEDKARQDAEDAKKKKDLEDAQRRAEEEARTKQQAPQEEHKNDASQPAPYTANDELRAIAYFLRTIYGPTNDLANALKTVSKDNKIDIARYVKLMNKTLEEMRTINALPTQYKDWYAQYIETINQAMTALNAANASKKIPAHVLGRTEQFFARLGNKIAEEIGFPHVPKEGTVTAKTYFRRADRQETHLDDAMNEMHGANKVSENYQKSLEALLQYVEDDLKRLTPQTK